MKKLLLLITLALMSATASAQFGSYVSGGYDGRGGRQSIWSGDPVHRDGFSNYLISTGAQYQMPFSDGMDPQMVYNLNVDVLFSFAGSRVTARFGKDYVSLNPLGIFWVFIGPTLGVLRGGGSEGSMMVWLLAGAMQWTIPLFDHLEITAGWDAAQFTKRKITYTQMGFYGPETISEEGTWYVIGNLNAGLRLFIGDHFWINAYYEYYHTHNTMIGLLNKIGAGMNEQPSFLREQAFGVRVGWMF